MSTPYQPAAYTPPNPTNTMAIVSLVLSVVGFHVVGAILGHIALGQIKQSGEAGRGLALAGVIIGWVGLGLVVVFTVLLVLGALGTAFFAFFATLLATPTPT
jgi:hypothetical protein